MAKFCTKCGQPNEPDALFCANCGSPLATVAQPAPVQAAAAPVTRSLPVVPILAGIGVVVLAALYFTKQGGSGGPDPLLNALVTTPLPPGSYSGWRVEDQPYVDADPDSAGGQVGAVNANLGKSGGTALGGFQFAVFRMAAQAQANYADATAIDATQFPKLTPDELAGLQQRVVTPTGMTASCLRMGTRAGSCHALSGRTVIYVFMDSDPVEHVAASAAALVAHVATLDK